MDYLIGWIGVTASIAVRCSSASASALSASAPPCCDWTLPSTWDGMKRPSSHKYVGERDVRVVAVPLRGGDVSQGPVSPDHLIAIVLLHGGESLGVEVTRSSESIEVFDEKVGGQEADRFLGGEARITTLRASSAPQTPRGVRRVTFRRTTLYERSEDVAFFPRRHYSWH